MKSIIIILGLPGSGKTTYANNSLSDSHKIYDDCLFNWYDRQLMEDIINKENIVLIDPRFCSLDTFFKYINKILVHVRPSDMNLIVFQNGLDNARLNLKRSKIHHIISEDELIKFYNNYVELLESMEFKYICNKINTIHLDVYKND